MAPGNRCTSRKKIYPREITGRFARLRVLSVWGLLGIYYLLPWFNWNDRQAVLFDPPARKFFIFGLVFWPQDFIFLALLLIIAALALFFFTAIGGRLWCGYACPQTVDRDLPVDGALRRRRPHGAPEAGSRSLGCQQAGAQVGQAVHVGDVLRSGPVSPSSGISRRFGCWGRA